MKTEGLNFLEAVKVLGDRKCEKIKNSFGIEYALFDGIVKVSGGLVGGIKTTPNSFLGEWSLIGVKQKAIFTGVKWHKTDKGNLYPTIKEWPDFQDLVNKPEMKMILEWEE